MGGLGDMLVAQTGLFLRRVGQVRFERRPTIGERREIWWAGAAKRRCPTLQFCSPNKAMTLHAVRQRLPV